MNNLENNLEENILIEEDDSSKTIPDNASNDEIALYFLNYCGINCTEIKSLNGTIFYRDLLLCYDKYNNLKKDIPKLKRLLTSTTYTSMQQNAGINQQWPLINLIRQILRKYNYQLIPKRICDGYTKDGKKKYKRLFEIKNKDL